VRLNSSPVMRLEGHHNIDFTASLVNSRQPVSSTHEENESIDRMDSLSSIKVDKIFIGNVSAHSIYNQVKTASYPAFNSYSYFCLPSLTHPLKPLAMKYTSVIAVALASVATASPTLHKRQNAQIATAISNWLNDIVVSRNCFYSSFQRHSS
jgi:hypothetical protein